MTTASAALAATPIFSVHKNGTDQTITASTNTKLTWSTEVFDTNNNFATDRFTPTVAGKYLIVVSARCAQPGMCVPSIYKNGALYAQTQWTNHNFADQAPQATAIIDMNGTTDYVEAFVYSTGDTIGGTSDRTYFSGSQVDGAGSGGSSQWIDGTSGAIYYNGGNVGIGTTSPGVKLEVVDTATSVIRSRTTAADSVAALHVQNDAKHYSIGVNGTAGDALLIYDQTSAATRLAIGTNGNVGIGTTSPSNKLEIAAGGGITLASDGTGLLKWGTAADIYGQSNQLMLRTNGAERIRIDATGNVGIGVTNPATKLEVGDAGTLRLTGHNTEPAYMELGFGRTGTGYAYIDLIGDTTYTDYGLRVIRYNGGANTSSEIMHRGTGAMILHNQEAAPLTILTSNLERVRVDPSGNVGIGTTLPSHILHITAQGRSTVASWATSSDARVKEDIHTISNGLDAIDQLRPVTFHYTDEYQNGNSSLSGLRRGFIAQEVEAVVPDMVTRTVEKVGNREIDDFRVLGNSDFVPLLVSAVKELKAANDNLRADHEAEIKSLRDEIEALKAAR